MNYVREQRTTNDDVAILFDPNALHTAVARAINRIAYDRLHKYEPRIRELTKHSEELVRGEALFHLVGTWGRVDMLDIALNATLHDSSSFVRQQLYSALSNLVVRHDTIDDTLARRVLTVLVAALLNEIDWTLQKFAYSEFQQILDGQEPMYKSGEFYPDTDVDWDRVQPYIEEAKLLSFTETIGQEPWIEVIGIKNGE